MEKHVFIFLIVSLISISAKAFETSSLEAFQVDVPVLKEVDVLVLGGSISGIASALMAKSLGEEVLIVEDKGFLGGALTASLEFSSYRFGWENDEELYAYLREKKAIIEGDIIVNPEGLKVALEELCREKEIPFLYWCRPLELVIRNKKIEGVVFASKGGVFLIKCKILIDATPFAQATYRFLLAPLPSLYIESRGFITLSEIGEIPPKSLILCENSPKGDGKVCRFLTLQSGTISPLELSEKAGELIKTITTTFRPLAIAPYSTIAPQRFPPTYRTIYLSDCSEGKKARNPIARGKGTVIFMDSQGNIHQWESKEVEVDKGFFISRQITNLLFTFGDKIPLQPGVAWLESLGISLKAGRAIGALSALAVKKNFAPVRVSYEELMKEVKGK
ncbi:FAD-dependent oxidoreductase [bacterium]|nr:FAD-dependent oxidoreductase [bacterium]